MQKNHHWYHLCQTREDYRELWDSGIGPGQKDRGVGDTIARIVRPIKRVAGCKGCQKRQEDLNRLLPYKQ